MQPSPSEVRDVLVRALELLGPEGEHWTKGAFFRDARGVPCFGRSAVCRCADAALAAAAVQNGLVDAHPSAALALAEAWRPGPSSLLPRDRIICANDDPSTTFPHVRSAFQRAIASLSEPEGRG